MLALGGVLVGNLLQVWLKVRERTWHRVDTTRIDVNDVQLKATVYSTTLYQLFHDTKIYEGKSEMDSHVEDLRRYLNSSYHEAISSVIKLGASSEPRIANTAVDARNDLISLHNKWARKIGVVSELELTALDNERQVATEKVSILMTMVEPRWWDRVWSFRTSKSAHKAIQKQRAKDARDENVSG
ncbi:hypothetical protein NHF46_11870 [Arthrobacter alpinus]|nr:hypothetical protein [Arthrobacter alpinus]